ncbi:hypothetical protein EV361DRAFT_911414, partial [Lentinula raphanica]
MDLEGYGSDKDGTTVSLASRVSRYASDVHLQIQLVYEQSPPQPCQVSRRFKEVESSVAIAGLETNLVANESIFDLKSISDDFEQSQYGSSDFDSEDESDDEFHDASEDRHNLERIVNFPGHTSQTEPGEIMHTGAAGVMKAISRVDEVYSKDSEKCRKRLQKSWSNSMAVTRTTSTVYSVSKGALSTG